MSKIDMELVRGERKAEVLRDYDVFFTMDSLEEPIGSLALMENGDIILSIYGECAYKVAHRGESEDCFSGDFENVTINFGEVKNLNGLYSKIEDLEDLSVYDFDAGRNVRVEDIFKKYKTINDKEKFVAYMDGIGGFFDFIKFYNEDKYTLYRGKNLSDVIFIEYGVEEGGNLDDEIDWCELRDEMEFAGYTETLVGTIG